MHEPQEPGYLQNSIMHKAQLENQAGVYFVLDLGAQHLSDPALSAVSSEAADNDAQNLLA